MTGSVSNPLEMSDEDFLSLNGPEALVGTETEATADAGVVAEPEAPVAEPDTETAAVLPGSAEGEAEDAGEGEPAADTAATTTETAEGASAAGTPAEGGAATPTAEGAGVAGAAAAAQEQTPPNYEELYKKIMAPFKANGKTIELKSEAEVISLMQMGANYTRKMQELKPHKATLLMLQEAGLDQQKLSFLIDLDKGDPEALKKFISDRKIDPLDIDTSTEHAYLGGNHQVSEQDVVFRDTLETVKSTQAGTELLQTVHTSWDDASKEMLYQNPDVMPMLVEQRESGVFDLIASEIDRQVTLGTLPASTPFFQAYLQVGQQLSAAEAEHRKATGNAGGTTTQVAPVVLGESVATPKSPVGASDKAAAAAPSRGTATKAKQLINPLAMSDDEFLAAMENRV